MSSSLGIMYKNVNYALAINSEAMLKLQEQAITGNRINRASDDPSDAYRVMNLNADTRQYENYTANLESITDLLDVSSAAVQDITDNISNARTLATQIATGTFLDEAGQRRIIAQAIDDIIEQVVSSANTKYLNQYVFGGNNSATAPFVVERDENGKITAVKYQGSTETRTVDVAPGVEASANLVGTNIFRCTNRSTPTFYGSTGAKAGSGTSTVSGDVWLSVADDGSGGYKLSIDDGVTYTAVPAGGEENTAVTDSRTGKILYVDTRSISSTGLEPVRVSGTYDIFNSLISARDLLLNTHDLSSKDIAELRNAMTTSLDDINKELARNLASIGGQINSLSTLKTSMDELKAKSQEQSDSTVQADIAQLSIDLSRRETLYQMSITVAGKLFSLSLLDFID